MKRVVSLFFKVLLAIFLSMNIVVAFHAYKFTHFYEKGEVTIKPPAEKTTWDKTKDILFGFKAVKKESGPIPLGYKTIYFNTKDGLKLEGWYYNVNEASGTVLLFHGHGGTKSSMINEANEFSRLGYNTLMLDFRAHGNSEGNTCTIGHRETEEVKLAYDHLLKTGEKNIILYGISMGAATITKAVHDFKLDPSKVILDMPFASISTAVRSRMRMMKMPEEPLSTLLTFWGGTENGFWAYGMKPYEFVKEIRCPVLLQVGRHDNRVSIEETSLIFSNIAGPKKMVVYENSVHESLCKKENDKWTTEISEFLKAY